MSWPRRVASPPGAAATRKITACSLRRCGPWALLPTLTAAIKAPLSPLFFYPAGVSFRFEEFYRYIKERGYAIYPGKLTEMDTFRIGNIGEIYPEDIDKLTSVIAAFLKERKEQIG